jgi:hypothetical protein
VVILIQRFFVASVQRKNPSVYAVYFSNTMYILINPLNTELNLIYHLLALLEAHHIFHVNRIRVKGQGRDNTKRM